jgi:raffinose/stachyose/melibiose transport system permease protein
MKMFMFVLPALICFTAIKLIPAVSGIYYSMTNWNGLNPHFRFIGLENFKNLFMNDPSFWKSMTFTLKYVVAAVILMNFVALLLALLIENLSRGKGAFRTIFYVPNMISMIIGGFMWQFIFNQVLYQLSQELGLAFLDQNWTSDAHFAFIAILVVAIWGGAGYLMVIYIAAIQGVPQVLTEAARIDGASAFQRFWHITLPLIRQAFTICFFVTLNNAFQVFDVVYSLTGGGPGRDTQVVAINIYEEAFARNNRFGYATAKSTILFLVILVITFFQLRVMKNRDEEA